MRNILYILLGITLICSCYKDKGNYDYRDPNLVTVRLREGLDNILMGKPHRISPEYTFSNPSDTSGFEYHWIFRGDTIGKGPELTHVFNSPEKMEQLYLYIKDPASGYQTVSIFPLTVTSEFAQGWVVLAAGDNQKSVIGFVRPISATDTTPKSFAAIPDLYETLFPGEILGYRPIALQATYTLYPLNSSQILVMQEQECVKLNGFNFSVDTLLRNEFLDSKWPDNFIPIQAHYSYLMDFLVDRDGDLYFRSIPARLIGAWWSSFYPCHYVGFPMRFEGEKMHVRRGTLYSEFYLAYERNNDRSRNRLVGICVNDWSLGVMFGFKQSYPNFQDLSDFGDYDLIFHEVLHGVESKNLVMILKKGDEYLLQTCEVGWGSPEDPGKYYYPSQKVFAGASLISENTLFFSPRERPLLFFAENDKLYYYDYAADQVNQLYDFSGRRVKAMETNPQVSELGVGLDNGEFVILDISEQNIGLSIVKYQSEGFGNRVVDIKYKFQDGYDLEIYKED